MPNAVPYTQFSGVARGGSDFWVCSGGPCTLTGHVTNATLGIADVTYADAATIQGSVQASQFIGKKVTFVWGFDTCSSPNGYGTQVASMVSTATSLVVDTPQLTPNCPDASSLSSTGSLNVGPDGIITLSISPKRASDGARDSAYYGTFIFQLTEATADTPPSASSNRASVSASVLASASVSSSGSTTVTPSGTGTSSLSGITTLTGSQLSDVPSLVPSWAIGQTASLPGSSPGVGPDDDSSSSNKGPIIGGIIAGVVAVVIGLTVLWFYLRKKRARQGGVSRIAPLSHDESAWGGAPGTGKWMKLGPSEKVALQAAEKDPNLLGVTNVAPGEPLVVSSDEAQPIINAESPQQPQSGVLSVTVLPEYSPPGDSNRNPVGDQRGPHTRDNTLRIHGQRTPSVTFSATGLPAYSSPETPNQDPTLETGVDDIPRGIPSGYMIYWESEQKNIVTPLRLTWRGD